MTKEQNALQVIKNIELSHMEYDSDENYDGEWEYEAVEVSDGTIKDIYPAEIKILEDAINVLNLFRNSLTLVTKSFPVGHDVQTNPDSSISVALQQAYGYIKHALDIEGQKTLTEWIIENIDREIVRKWLDESK